VLVPGSTTSPAETLGPTRCGARSIGAGVLLADVAGRIASKNGYSTGRSVARSLRTISCETEHQIRREGSSR
jgi:hypothetical protein